MKPKQKTKLYICDGCACLGNASNCYINGGDCVHTSKEEHSIKKRLGDDFPPTTFVNIRGTLVENGDVTGVRKGMYDGKLNISRKFPLL